ncbi:hypothetical protein GCK72_019321 [Caenorhabditis remanei]|uniref:CX domain-containing protein n=1 Tax=Caenorhabditis remanei TaxID=31234 RepID=E3LK10_CAERE|nr:hypothetical protein GCK72_019321 [Caenorhabditis remanei]EFO99858.1 hypothetical protein CRE_18591 [Caenorhabditis remanei]KAF1752766.1 hypothetical protein GCK72_019321 [Caenorhabditis remanei]
MRLVLILTLLASTSTASTATTLSPFQQQNMDLLLNILKDYKVIEEPSHPIFYQGVAFYWYGAYTPSPDHPQTCIIMASHPDWPFVGNIFKNGTLPTSAIFGCHQGKTCRGAKCVEQLSHSNVVTYTLLGVVLFLIVCLFGGEKKTQQQRPMERPCRGPPRDPSFDNIFLPQEHRVRFDLPPRYSE